MNGLATIHDDCLEYELEIISIAEELTEKTPKSLQKRKSGKFQGYYFPAGKYQAGG